MQLSFDHLVHFVHRPPAEAARLFREAGFHAVTGGRHTHWGTWNSLSYFGLSYVEFLAVEDAAVAGRSDNPLIAQLVAEHELGEGLGQIALRTSEMDRWVERFRSLGLKLTGPVDGSRTRDDGKTLRWRMLFAEDPQTARKLPFLIEWQETDEERQADLTQRGIIASHPNGAAELLAVGFAVANLDAAAADWTRWFGLQGGEVFTDERLGARCLSLALPGGSIVLCEPTQPGAAQQALAASGERPFFAKIGAANALPLPHDICGGIYLT